MRRILLIALLIRFLPLSADEGMWIPMLLEQVNEKEMKSLGMRISARDIYDINHSSIKDAIFLFGGGCTAVAVSENGLILTNHHCGFGEIQNHSTLENNYLRDGFWAKSYADELVNPSLTVTRLVRMEDVTDQMLTGIAGNTTEKQRDSLLLVNRKALEKKAVEGTDYQASVRSYMYGNDFYLLITETFKDVRLVGAPPSSIGKFGGDTDNWMWPRHTGDFSVFRIYAGKDNKPAAYAADNKPYKPGYVVPVSLKGAQEGDFTFVFGYPGRTQEYLPSYAIQMITEVENPVKIQLREERLKVFKEFMNRDEKIRIQYASKDAGVANAWKKWIGESEGIEQFEGVAKKQAFEADFTKWVNSDFLRSKKYSKLLPSFETKWKELTPLQMAAVYMREALAAPEIMQMARNLARLEEIAASSNPDTAALRKIISGLKPVARDFFHEYQPQVDKEVMKQVYRIFLQKADAAYCPAALSGLTANPSSVETWVEKAYSKSWFDDSTTVYRFLDHFKLKDIKKLKSDPFFQIFKEASLITAEKITPGLSRINKELDSLMRVYVQAQMEMKPDGRFYPDANSTLRVSYGHVKGFEPRDAVVYKHFTTLDGVIDKDNPAIYDYQVDARLKKLYASKNFGRYGVNGTLPVAFIATNHTSGGNSGSPVFNADGQLLGLNFDRVWEGTMSDLMYSPDRCRNITVDIRYCLFIMDVFANAGHLVKEMKIVE